MRKLAGIIATLLFWLGATGVATGICGSGPPLPPDGLQWPLAGEIASGWTLDCETDRGHRGVDIIAEPGSPVRAAAGGRVIFAGYTPAEGGGTTISIEHPGGLRSTYLHVTEPTVRQGDEVASGQAIGSAGDRPLHFGLKLPGSRDSYFNPLELIGPLTSASHEPAASDAPALAPQAEPAAAAAGGELAAGLESPAPAALPAALPQPATVVIATSPTPAILTASLPLIPLPGSPLAAMLSHAPTNRPASTAPPPAPAGAPSAAALLTATPTNPAALMPRGGDLSGSLPAAVPMDTVLRQLKKTAPVGGERWERADHGGALPAAAAALLLVGALAAVRITARWDQVPGPASAQPTAPW